MTIVTKGSVVTRSHRHRRLVVAHVLLFVAANLIAATWDGSFPVAVLSGDVPLSSALDNFTGEALPRISLYVTRLWALLVCLDVAWTAVMPSIRRKGGR